MQRLALLFTDLVDSTALIERLGDREAARVLDLHDRMARDLLVEHDGREVDRTDGFFLAFAACERAARFALAYQAALVPIGLLARVGLHVGDVNLRLTHASDIERGARPFVIEGIAVPTAARIMALAGGGQILLTREAYDAIAPSLHEPAQLRGHGHYRMKGIAEPLDVYELGRRDVDPFTPPVDADKAHRVVRGKDFWQPVRAIRHTLPAERDAFVGRASDLNGLSDRLDAGARLVSLFGPGGTGKTRLARRYGWTRLGDWPGGVYFCDVSDAHSPEGIYSALSIALGVTLGPLDLLQQLGHVIAGRGRCLVVLDNFEQVVAHAQETIGTWLERACDVVFVVTTRERLRIPGEEVVALEPLPLVTDAVELFTMRARAQKADFRITDANETTVRRIVALLDGMPLAIELAAARIRLLSPAQIVDRLQDRFALLAGVSGASARQATLRATIDWSWELLSPWEQAALAQCAIFEGGFTLAAAEAVIDLSIWPRAPSALDTVQALVDKSLVRSWTTVDVLRVESEEPRFGMYLTIREYAIEKLIALEGERAGRAAERHVNFFSTLGSDDAIDALRQHGAAERRRALAVELDNLVAACRRAIAHGRPDAAVALYRAAWEVLGNQGPVQLAIALGNEVLAMDGLGASHAIALQTQGMALIDAGCSDEAAQRFEHARSLTRDAGNPHAAAAVLTMFGMLRRMQGRSADARVLLDDALTLARTTGDHGDEGRALQQLGMLDRSQGAIEQARIQYQAALALFREVGDPGAEGAVLSNLAITFAEQGRLAEAEEHFRASLTISRELDDVAHVGLVLGNLGCLFADRGQFESALIHHQQALAIHRDLGNRREEGTTLGNLGGACCRLGRRDEGMRHFEAALRMARDVADPRVEAFVLRDLSGQLLAAGQLDAAWAHASDALKLDERIGDRLEQGASLALIGEILYARRLPAEASSALARAEQLARATTDALGLCRIFCVRARGEAGIGERDAARAALVSARAALADAPLSEDSDAHRELAAVAQLLDVR